MSKRFYARGDWGARSPKGPMASQPSIGEVFIHHTDNEDAGGVDSLSEQKAAMRGIQDFHMDDRGWSDIAYHAIVFQPQRNVKLARVFLGRPPVIVPAAQQGHNTGTLAIAVYGDFTRDTLDRNTRYAIEQTIRRYAPNAKTIGGHRDVFSTTCPGPNIYKQLDLLAKATGLKRYQH